MQQSWAELRAFYGRAHIQALYLAMKVFRVYEHSLRTAERQTGYMERSISRKVHNITGISDCLQSTRRFRLCYVVRDAIVPPPGESLWSVSWLVHDVGHQPPETIYTMHTRAVHDAQRHIDDPWDLHECHAIPACITQNQCVMRHEKRHTLLLHAWIPWLTRLAHHTTLTAESGSRHPSDFIS